MASDYEQLSRDLPSTMGTAAIAGAIAAEEEAEQAQREGAAAPHRQAGSGAGTGAARPSTPGQAARERQKEDDREAADDQP